MGGAVERQQGFRNGIGPDDREALLQGLSGGEPQDFPRPGKEDEARVRMRKRQTGEEFLRTLLFGRGRFQKFEAGGDGGEEVADFDDRSLVQAARPCWASTPCSIWMKAASGSASSEVRKADSMRKLDTDAMLGRASPRNPKELMCQRSSILVILLVAWRVTASSSSAAGMPAPLSLTRMRLCRRFPA